LYSSSGTYFLSNCLDPLLKKTADKFVRAGIPSLSEFSTEEDTYAKASGWVTRFGEAAWRKIGGIVILRELLVLADRYAIGEFINMFIQKFWSFVERE
jgi:hypothetical protein